VVRLKAAITNARRDKKLAQKLC